jgi:hypothetical protein
MTLDELLVALGLLLTGVGIGLAVVPVLESRRRRAGQCARSPLGSNLFGDQLAVTPTIVF